jgi:anti-sigma28 factor (negative regulator of flagellin synthesis)
MDLQAELERMYGANKQRSQSLSDRLNAIDSYVGQTSPQIRAEMTDFSNRPVGYNPIDDYRSAFEVSQANRDYRSAAAQDFESSQTAGMTLLQQLADLAESQKKDSGDDLLTEIKKEALKKQVKDGTLTIDPKTGELTVAAQTDEQAQLRELVEELKGVNLGPITGRLQIGKWTKDPEALYAQSRLDQVISLLSLENRKKLKGSGAISDKEMGMLEKSVAAIQSGIGEDDVRKELAKIEKIVNKGQTTNSGGKGGKKRDLSSFDR